MVEAIIWFTSKIITINKVFGFRLFASGIPEVLCYKPIAILALCFSLSDVTVFTFRFLFETWEEGADEARILSDIIHMLRLIDKRY